MKTSKLIVVLVSALALTICVTPSMAGPVDDKSAQEKEIKDQSFKGKVESVDTTAKTVTVDAKTYTLTDSSQIMKQGKSATVAELVVGDEVHGKFHEVNGKNEVVSLLVTAKKTKDS